MSRLLQASDITFAYGDRAALRGVSVTVAANEIVGILGPNGSGKSTLIRTLMGQLIAASGSIEWEGKPISDWSRRELAKRAAYLPQSPSADPDQTVHDVLRLGRSPYWRAFGIESARDEEVVRDVAGRLELNDLLARPIAELSGGQRQRVFIGRCLVQEPAALLLDEPSTFLDLRHQVELLRTLRSLARERSLGVLMASHDLNLAAMFCDRLLVLKEGAVISNGTPQDVMHPDVLARAFEVTMEIAKTGSGRSVVVPVIPGSP